MKRKLIRLRPVSRGFASTIFDIVNGFLIDAVAHSVTGVRAILRLDVMHHKLDVIIWLRYLPHDHKTSGFYAGLSLMVWILKREVRAFGGCLGTYRR